MASTKKTTKSKANSKESKTERGYVWQHFTPKAIALIQKYNLQSDENYKKLISSFEKIRSLPKEDERKLNLVELWEEEFNRLFKEFWENYSSESKKIDKGINGWKDRLDIKQEATTPDAKRQFFMSRLTVNNNAGQNTKDEILNRAGYKKDVDVEKFNFTAQAKTGKNLLAIESMLDEVSDTGFNAPESMLSNSKTSTTNTASGFGMQSGTFDTDLDFEETPNHTLSDINVNDTTQTTEEFGKEPVPDPNLAAFVNDSQPFVDEAMNLGQNQSTKEMIVDESMTREEFNEINNVKVDSVEKTTDNSDFELGIDFYQANMTGGTEPFNYRYNVSTDEKLAHIEVAEIDPEKRNIHSKEGFEIVSEFDKPSLTTDVFVEEEKTTSKPFHEIKPVGHYQISYDLAKRPSMNDVLEHNENEIKTLDEMTEKLDFLRELRNERRHRVTMMKLERSNSYIVARARRMAENRELLRIKKREDINLKAIEKADRMRRLHERQRLIELMKERQIKRAEEKRVAQVLRLERQRRFERDAKYRTEIASIDAQIRHEQELIKRTELKMKAYFTKVNDDRIFDESLKAAKKTNKYSVLEEKAEKVAQIEQQKRKDRIEKISRKFVKNIK